MVGEAGPTVILAGDFNTVSWSPRLGRLAEHAGLSIARGLEGTWPAPLPMPFRLPIDHVLTSSDLHVHDRAVGPAVGSDHRPVTVTVRLADH